jgi:KaiC/GvpD/RAD55 family RecA-like ATPase
MSNNQLREEAVFLELPIFSQLAPGGFDYGKVFLVEFEPQSIWYEASFTIAANALKRGTRTEYHTFTHIPGDIRQSLARFGLDVEALEHDKKILRIIDSYTIQTGLGTPEQLTSKAQKVLAESVKVSDWSISDAQILKAPPDEDAGWLHVDDNVSALANYNDEKAILNYWRTRMVPGARRLQTAFLNALLVQVHSDSFYRQFESLCDGILDFRSRENGNRLVHEARVRIIRGRAYDSRWRQLELIGNGEVRIVD